MTERELTEAAARSIGFSVIQYSGDGTLAYVTDENGHVYSWNPLYDEGAALRLAAKLNMKIERFKKDGKRFVIASVEWDKWVMEPLGDDPVAAWCIAIVRAAAEIGKGVRVTA